MITRSKIYAAWHGGRVATLAAGMAALSVATLGFASAAGGTTPSLVKPLGASASTYLAGYQATPTGGLASASVTFTVPTVSCTATDKADSAIEWTGVYTNTLETEAFVDGFCESSGPIYSYVLRLRRVASSSPVRRRATSSSPRCSSRAPRPGPKSTT